MDPEKSKSIWQRVLITSGFVLLTAIVVGGITWYVMDRSASEIKTANDKSVAELQKQINELNKNKDSILDSDKTDATTNETSMFKITELGIQFVLDKTISDAYYHTTNTTSASFSTNTLTTAGGTNCRAENSPIGIVALTTLTPLDSSSPDFSPDRATGAFIKQIGNKYLYYYHSQSACSENQNVAESIQGPQSDALMASLRSATAI